MHHHATDQRQAAAHVNLGQLLGHAFALGHLVIALPEVAVTVVIFDIHHLVVHAFCQAQAKAFDALADDGGAANQNRFGQTLVQHNLRSTQHALVFAFGKTNAFFRAAFGRAEDGLHRRAGGIDQGLQFFAVRVHVGDRALRHAAGDGCLHHRWRNLHHQARVKRFGNQVLGAEGQVLACIRCRDHFALLGLRELGNRMHRSHFHFRCDGGCACVECAAKNIRKTQNVVDLIRVIGATGGHDGVVTHFQHFFGQDFRCGVGQRQYQRTCGHDFDHLGFEHATSGQAQEHIRVGDHVAQSAGRGFLHKLDLVFVHQFGAALIHHTHQVGDPNISARHAQFHQHAQTSQGGCTRARGHELDFGNVFTNHFQAIQNGRTHHDGGAVLIVMEHRNLHALAQFALDIKTIRRFDVF